MSPPILTVIFSFIAAAAGAYLGAYFRQKGKNLATREDLEQITQMAEGIKAQISEDVWDRQRRWETQRDVMFDVVTALDVSRRLLSEMLATFRATTDEGFDDSQRATYRADVRKKWMAADDSLEHAVALAGLVSSAEVYRSLLEVSQEMKNFALEALGGNDPEPSIPGVSRKVHGIVASVRRDLRLGDQQVTTKG